MTARPPRTRWEDHEGTSGYADHFAGLIARGEDVDGEARLVDTVAPRGARILDAGSGIGRVAAALAARGHDVTAVEKDPDLVRKSRERYPHVPVIPSDILGLAPEALAAAGRPAAYDVVVVVGNVMVYLGEDTEEDVLRLLGGLLAPGGRLVVGFRTHDAPEFSRRSYPAEEFIRDAAAAGLALEHRFGSYDLRPPAEDYLVAVLHLAAD
jgi:SAM-dependent methyltransferase